jgi:hypothetical protein
MWECPEVYSDELPGPILPARGDSLRKAQMLKYTTLSPAVSGYESRAIDEVFVAWWDLITNFRARELTHASDRVMAFAGVAEAFQAEHGLTYLAGAWAEFLPYDLLWHAWYDFEGRSDDMPYLSRPLICKELADNSMPSWSWFGLPVYTTQLFDNHHRKAMTFSRLSKDYRTIFSASLTHFRRPNLPQTSRANQVFHEFVGLNLALNVATYKTTLTRSRRSLMKGRPNFDDGKRPLALNCISLREQLVYVHCRGNMGHFVQAPYYCDDPNNIESPPENVLLALLHEQHVSYRLYEGEDEGRSGREEIYWLRGSGLQPGQEPDTWERHGYWEAQVIRGWYDDMEETISSSKDEEDFMKEDGRIREKDSLFLCLEGVKRETLTIV